MPTQLAERPELDTEAVWYFNVYSMLESERPPAQMAATLIPLSAIVHYARTFGTIEDDLQTFCEIILGIDNKYIAYVNRPKPKQGAVR